MTRARALQRQERSRQYPSPAATGIADAINDQIQFAEALSLAVFGAAYLEEFQSEPICHMIEVHIARLEAIAASFAQLRGGS